MTSSATVERPAAASDAADVLRAAADAGRAVRVVGGGTRQGWGRDVDAELELVTAGLDVPFEHNRGDLTAVLGAGTRLAAAQRTFAEAGQMLALDPPDRPDATIGGLVATGDSGPLRHRHGAVRDLILGATVALPDGSLARAGGRVIKNVAGYDLAKLMCGAFGTLGVVVEAVFRLHPRPAGTVTAVGSSANARALAAAAAALARAPLELACLDASWQGEQGAVLARAAGSAPDASAANAARTMTEAGLQASVEEDDEPLWRAQREGQRSAEGVLLRVSGNATQLPAVLDAARSESARMVGRAGLGLYWLTLPASDEPTAAAAVARVRERLRPSPCVILDAPPEVRAAVDPWDLPLGPELALMRRLKARFDPTATCNPGRFVGGI